MKRDGFTIVELSIVLVIAGLLVGGILLGRGLVRTSELRSVSTDYQKYKTAIDTFRGEFTMLPGDFTKATQYWGAAASCPTTASTDTSTCDGDGDGVLEYETTNPNSSERFRFWQHLANAGSIEGSYTGAAGSGGAGHAIAGVNSPKSRLTNGVWATHNMAISGITDNVLILGAKTGTSAPLNGLITSTEAYNIDTKLDDGKPDTGIMNGVNAGGSNCSSGGIYNLATNDNSCFLLFQFSRR